MMRIGLSPHPRPRQVARAWLRSRHRRIPSAALGQAGREALGPVRRFPRACPSDRRPRQASADARASPPRRDARPGRAMALGPGARPTSMAALAIRPASEWRSQQRGLVDCGVAALTDWPGAASDRIRWKAPCDLIRFFRSRASPRPAATRNRRGAGGHRGPPVRSRSCSTMT